MYRAQVNSQLAVASRCRLSSGGGAALSSRAAAHFLRRQLARFSWKRFRLAAGRPRKALRRAVWLATLRLGERFFGLEAAASIITTHYESDGFSDVDALAIARRRSAVHATWWRLLVLVRQGFRIDTKFPIQVSVGALPIWVVGIERLAGAGPCAAVHVTGLPREQILESSAYIVAVRCIMNELCDHVRHLYGLPL